MATVLPTRLDIIYLNIQTWLLRQLGFEPEQVLLMDPEALPAHKHPSNPQVYLVLWPAAESANAPIYRGADRLDTRLLERFEVTIRTRTALDDYKARQVWLTDPDIGHLQWRHQVWNALIGYTPTDDSENMLTAGPLEPAQSTRPRMTDEKHYYGESRIGLQFWYIAALTPTFMASPPVP